VAKGAGGWLGGWGNPENITGGADGPPQKTAITGTIGKGGPGVTPSRAGWAVRGAADHRLWSAGNIETGGLPLH